MDVLQSNTTRGLPKRRVIPRLSPLRLGGLPRPIDHRVDLPSRQAIPSNVRPDGSENLVEGPLGQQVPLDQGADVLPGRRARPPGFFRSP
jgi:hypothetical protein